MNCTEAILAELHRIGAQVGVHDDKLRIDAPRGVVTPALLERVRNHKPELLAALAGASNQDNVSLSVENAAPSGEKLCEVVVGGRGHDVVLWDGTPLDGGAVVAADTETEPINGNQIPRLALLTASTGNGAVVMPGDKVAEFFEAHADRHFVFQNVAFDFWVLHDHLVKAGHHDVAALLWELCRRNRLHDTMLLDALIAIARTGNAEIRNLATVAETWAGITEVDKDDPFRLRFGELIGADWDSVDRGFFQYAGADSIATCHAFQHVQIDAARLADDVAAECIDGAIEYFGSLTAAIQVRASIALAAVERNGFLVDRDNLARVRRFLARKSDRIARRLARRHDAQKLFVATANGFALTPTGKVKLNNDYLRQQLEIEAQRVRENASFPVVPLCKDGQLSTAAEHWKPYRKHSAFINLWQGLVETSQLMQFVRDPGEDRIHSRYSILTGTGRTSCSGPNLQQVPRSPRIRGCFVAPPGHKLIVADYGFIELLTLAATCRKRFGVSRLADVIEQGDDPHAFTAALFCEMPLDEFLRLKETDPQRFRDLRQRAKATNFGIPGGLQAPGLVEQARKDYGVEFDLHEAEELRRRLIADVYPELQEYLKGNLMDALAENLGCDVRPLWQRASGSTARPEWLPWAMRRVVLGLQKANGGPYDPGFSQRIWHALSTLCRNETLKPFIDPRLAGDELADRLFGRSAVTLTGRIRGRSTGPQAWNLPFQGLAADGGKLALFELVARGYKVVAFVHDEFIVEVPCQNVERARQEVPDIMAQSMQSVLGTDLPITVECEVADEWVKP